MANRHMERCLISLIIKEMKDKTTMSYHLTALRIAIIKMPTITCVGKNVKKRKPCSVLVGLQTGAATMKNSMEIPQKTKN